MSSSPLKPFGILGDQLYFSADDGNTGRELYTYNGVNVSLSVDINPGDGDSAPIDFTLYDNKLFFGTNNGSLGSQLFSFDGNSAQVVETYPAQPTGLTVYDGELFYFVQSTAPNSGGVGFHKYDGSTAQYLANIGQGLNFIVNDTVVFGNELLFEGFFPGTGLELLKYDGTSVSLVEDLNPGQDNGVPGSFAVYEGNLYFGGTTGINGSTLYKYDGSNVSMVEGFDTNEGPADLTVFDGELFFQASKFATRSELYKYDGNAVSLAAEISPGIDSSLPRDLTLFNGELFFSAFHSATGSELYKYDGSSVSLVADINPGSTGSGLHDFFVFDDQLFFIADDGVHGTELFKLSVIPEPTSISLLIICAGCHWLRQSLMTRKSGRHFSRSWNRTLGTPKVETGFQG